MHQSRPRVERQKKLSLFYLIKTKIYTLNAKVSLYILFRLVHLQHPADQKGSITDTLILRHYQLLQQLGWTNEAIAVSITCFSKLF